MNKKEPQKCQSKMCCKATAQLNAEIVDELMSDDKSLGELLSKKEKEQQDDVLSEDPKE
jgi:hypothetical protein|tara:strand:+ start:936 stop:1112 length:177 start_codon:yes stop_codon:yes gene_type:complete